MYIKFSKTLSTKCLWAIWWTHFLLPFESRRLRITNPTTATTTLRPPSPFPGTYPFFRISSSSRSSSSSSESAPLCVWNDAFWFQFQTFPANAIAPVMLFRNRLGFFSVPRFALRWRRPQWTIGPRGRLLPGRRHWRLGRSFLHVFFFSPDTNV